MYQFGNCFSFQEVASDNCYCKDSTTPSYEQLEQELLEEFNEENISEENISEEDLEEDCSASEQETNTGDIEEEGRIKDNQEAEEQVLQQQKLFKEDCPVIEEEEKILCKTLETVLSLQQDRLDAETLEELALMEKLGLPTFFADKPKVRLIFHFVSSVPFDSFEKQFVLIKNEPCTLFIGKLAA